MRLNPAREIAGTEKKENTKEMNQEEVINMAEKDKEVQKRYQQELTRYKKQVEKINKIEKKRVA